MNEEEKKTDITEGTENSEISEGTEEASEGAEKDVSSDVSSDSPADNEYNAEKSEENNDGAGKIAETSEKAPLNEEAKESKPKEKKKGTNNPFKSKKFRHGSLSVVFTIMFIVGVVLINVIVNALLERFDISADLTAGAIFTLDPASEEYVRGVNDDISIYVTAERDTLKSSNNTLYEQIVEFLDKMAALNPRLTVKYVNLLTDPDFSNNYTEDLTNYQIIVQSGNTGRYKILDMSGFLRVTLSDGNSYEYNEQIAMYVNYGIYSIMSYASTAEEQLISAIMTVTKENRTVVSFLTGYGESDSSALEKVLNDNAYDVRTVEIDRVEAVPEETDIAVIYGPTKDYSLDAVTKVDEWLSNGGKYGKDLVYIATVDAAVLPNIGEYLSEWGLEQGNGLIIQADSKYGYSTGIGFYLMQDLEIKEDTDYYENMKKASASTLRAYPARPINMLWEEKSNISNKVIASAYGESCILFPFDASDDWQPGEGDLRGFDVIIESSKVQFEGTTPYYSKVIAIGSDTLFSEYFTTASNFSNAEMALTLFDTNSDNKGTSISITEKSFTAETYQLSGNTQMFIGLTFAVFIPVVIIIIGIVVWARRRRL